MKVFSPCVFLLMCTTESTLKGIWLCVFCAYLPMCLAWFKMLIYVFDFGICAHVFVLVFGVVQDERCLPMGQEKGTRSGWPEKNKVDKHEDKDEDKDEDKG